MKLTRMTGLAGWLRAGLIASACGLAAGCGGGDAGPSGYNEDEADHDGVDDTFLSDGKTDVEGITEQSPEACAVLRLANEADLETLDYDVGIYSLAAQNILAVRAGADRVVGTYDDGWLKDLAALDAVKYVGPKCFAALRAYAQAHQEFSCGVVDVQLLALNDLHGNLNPPGGSSGRIVTGPDPAVNFVEAGGIEYLAAHVAAKRAENPNTIVVSGGDNIGASPLLSALFHDEPTVEALNLLGLELSAVGNHELDESLAELERIQQGGCHPTDGCADGDEFSGAAFRYLAANVIDETSGQPIFPSYLVKHYRGAHVGFIGVTLREAPLVSTPAGVAGLEFRDEAAAVNELVGVLRGLGVETIVVLAHQGGATTGPYNGCDGATGPLFELRGRLDPAVDVLVGAHTNAAHVCRIGEQLVTSAASNGRLLTDIDLQIDAVTGALVTSKADNVIVTRTVDKDPAQSALIAKYTAVSAPLANRVLAAIGADITRVANPAGESALGDVLADAQLEATRATGAVASFINSGGIRADLTFGQLSGGEAQGEVTYAEAFAVQPFGNTLFTMTVTGAQLDTMLEQQWRMTSAGEKVMMLQVSEGFGYAWDPSKPIGERVDPASITLNGEPVDPSTSYRITVNNFLADGGDGFAILKSGTDRVGGMVDLDAFTAYLGAHSPLQPGAADRIAVLLP